MSASPAPPDARARLLDEALRLVRAQGWAATSVDALCRAAGVTKGAFFHHFRSKEELGVAAVGHWSEVTGGLFAAAGYHAQEDPLDRVLGYLRLRRDMLGWDGVDYSCLVGTTVQEVHRSSPAIRDAGRESIRGHVAPLTADLRAAMGRHGVTGPWTAESLALHTQAVLQGAFILAKAHGPADGPRLAAESVDHLIRYVGLLFGRPDAPPDTPPDIPTAPSRSSQQEDGR